MPSSETEEHKNLKRLASLWAKDQGYSCHGSEIGLPHTGYRADVAAYKPAYEAGTITFEGKLLKRRRPVVGTTAVFECKQSRSDLLKDACIAANARTQLQALDGRRAVLERLLKIHFPSAANGDSLFQEFQTYGLDAVNHKGYQSVLRKIAILQTALFQKTKFEKLVRYEAANLLYLVTLDEILEDYEVPLKWGLLVKKGDRLERRLAPVWINSDEGTRLGVLQRIAMAKGRDLVAGGGSEKFDQSPSSGDNSASQV